MILDILFPKWCLACGRIGVYICEGCRKQLEYVEKDGCLYCDKITVAGCTHEQCKRANGIDGLQSMLYYSPLMQKVMRDLKYGQVHDAYYDFFWSLNPEFVSKLAFYSRFRGDIYFQPLPLHNRRLQARGFNQSKLLAQLFSCVTKIPVIDILVRTKDTPQQARQGSRWARYLNTRNAFSVTNAGIISGKNIIIVDDVITSGSTVKEVGRVLKIAGAKHVFALSLLRD